ncbi:ATP-binding protein [bacterium]
MNNLKESEKLELKKSTSELKEAVISICSMLNKYDKATVCFGIKDDGTVIGQDIGKNTLKNVTQFISSHIEPKIYPNVKIKKIMKKECIVVEAKGLDRPYFAYGRGYMRVGEEDRQLSIKELEKFIIHKHKDNNKWEKESSKNTIDKVNLKVIKDFINRANEAGRINYKFDNKKNVLHKLELIKGSKLLNAGEVLFCDKNSLEVQAAVFAGKDKITFLDIKMFEGNLFDLLDKSESYIAERINWRVKFGKLEREEIPEVPIKAIREALVNSLCHRDYTNPKGNEIAIFKDRIEIYNPGNFPEGHTPEDFIKGRERSILRNPLLAETIYKSKEIEKWGSGLKRIYDECKANKVKVDFDILKSGFLVTFHRRIIEGKEEERWSEKVVRKGGQKRWSELTDRQQEIIGIISNNPKISRAKLSLILKINESALQKHIEKLKEKKVLKRVGPAKGGHWKILD